MIQGLTRFLKAFNSLGVNASALPMTGMTFTRGDNLLINSISISLRLHYNLKYEKQRNGRFQHSRMAGRRDEIKEGVDSIVAETRITLYTGLFSENVVVLTFKVSHDFLEAIDEIS